MISVSLDDPNLVENIKVAMQCRKFMDDAEVQKLYDKQVQLDKARSETPIEQHNRLVNALNRKFYSPHLEMLERSITKAVEWQKEV